MRDYLYIWNDPVEHFILASGIEFKALSKAVIHKSLWLLDSEFYGGKMNFPGRFVFVTEEAEKELVRDDVHGYGDFSWADSKYDHELELTKKEIAELAYFARCSEPYDWIGMPSLRNDFLVFAHDDGWFLKMYYTAPDLMSQVLRRLQLPPDFIKDVMKGDKAYYVDKKGTEIVERTLDVDSILTVMYNRNKQRKLVGKG
jgi:hypothetical protein